MSPTSKNFQLVVANYNGPNNGYKLEVSLSNAALLEFDPSQFGNEKPRDFEQPRFNPPPSTPQDNGFGGGTGEAFLPAPPNGGQAPPAAAPAGFAVPNIPGGKADPMLVAIGDVDVRSGLGLRAVKVESTIATMNEDNSGGLAVTLGLLTLPLVVGAVAGFLLFRRRGSSRSPAAATS